MAAYEPYNRGRPAPRRRVGRSVTGWALCLVLLLVAIGSPITVHAQTPLPHPPFARTGESLPDPPFAPPVYPLAPPNAPIPAPPGDSGGIFRLARSNAFAFFVQPNPVADAGAVVASLGPDLDIAYAEFSVLFGIEMQQPVGVYVYATDAAYAAATADLGPASTGTAGITPDPMAGRLHIRLDDLAARSPLERENALRHGTAQVLLGLASGGNLPRGLAEGMATYVERPVTPQLARIAAITNGAFQAGNLLSWSDLNRRRPVRADSDLVAAESYAMVAFLVDRYGLRSFRGMLGELREKPDWRLAMRSAYNRSSNEIESQWRDNLPRWAASEWRDNLVAAFDLEKPRTVLAAGDYAGAKTLLEQSWRLFRDLDDQERLAETEAMLSQADVGIQAETAMTQAQEALELHTYDRAEALLVQARTQYDQLPFEHRPETTLDTYEALASSGLTAMASLDDANRRKTRWNDYPEVRAAALDAGTRFAALGDDDMRAGAVTVLDELDARQRRLVLLLSALAAITAAWLALWLWTRGPRAMDWR